MNDDMQNKAHEPVTTYDAQKPVTDFSMLDLNKLYTYAQYLRWKFDERVELIKGKIFKMSPSPLVRHQRILGVLHLPFAQYLKGHKCDVFLAPFDVRLPKDTNDKNPYTVVQPDLCVICDPEKLDEKGFVGAPDLIIEILSPSTSAKDTGIKFELYQEHGVREYWIVDPSNNILDVFVPDENGKYRLVQKYCINDTVRVNILPELEIDLNEVFQEA